MSEATMVRFGRLLVIGDGPRLYGRMSVSLLVRCDCGREKVVAKSSLERGRTTSCGCFRSEVSGARTRTHGLARTSEYRVWSGIKTRCYNTNERSYADYGGRGIVMCESWKNSFAAFLSDMGKRPSLNHTIERRDVNGGYTPDNCFWMEGRFQPRNTRVNRTETYREVTACVAELCDLFDVDVRRVYWRLARGWTIADAIERPTRIWPNQHHRRAT